MEEFKVGDVVQLKSGGEKMTISQKGIKVKINKLNLLVVSIVLVLFSGCASKPGSLPTTKISEAKANKYDKYNCQQIENKLYFLKKEIRKLAKEQNGIIANNDDRRLMTAVLLITIPLVPFVGEGDGDTAKAYSKAKGEYVYIKELVIEKNCQININRSNVEIEMD